MFAHFPRVIGHLKGGPPRGPSLRFRRFQNAPTIRSWKTFATYVAPIKLQSRTITASFAQRTKSPQKSHPIADDEPRQPTETERRQHKQA